MKEEIKSIEKKSNMELRWVLSAGTKKIGVKWIYKTKLNDSGEVDKYEERSLVKGYTQEHRIDYTEMYAPMARMDTLRMILPFAVQKSWKLYPFRCQLQKALYGLKQAPGIWFSLIEFYFIMEGFKSSYSEQTLFIRRNEEFKHSMKKEFDMTDLGQMRFFLRTEVIQSIFLCQRKYAAEVLNRFGVENYNCVCNPIVSRQKIVVLWHVQHNNILQQLKGF